MLTTIPTDDELDQRAAALLPSVLDTISIQTRTRRNRRRGIVGAGATALFATGLLIGATALAPVMNPGTGTAVDSHNRVVPAVFALECYGDAHETIDNQYSDHRAANAVIADLRGTCVTAINSLREDNAVTAKATELAKAGAACGTIRLNGVAWQWTATRNADGTFNIGSGTGTTVDWPVSCRTPAVPLSVAAFAPTVVAVCAIASNWAAVYPSPHASAAATCADHGYRLWNS